MNQIKTNRKLKILIAALLLLVLLVGCGSVVDPETGKVMIEHVISLDTPWNFSEMGFFTAIFIYPMAQILNWLASKIGVTLAIIVLTLGIKALTLRSTIKSTVATQKMQLIQPEMTKIQEKYKDRTDQQAQLRMGQEIQALYKKHDVKMSAAFTPMLIQMPILIAVWQSVQRAQSVIDGELFGYSLAVTLKDGMLQLTEPFYFIIFIIMGVSVALGMLGPRWLTKQAQKKLPVYKQSDKPQQGQGMMYFMLVFMLYIGFTLPTAMSIYLATSNVAQFLTQAYIQKNVVNKEVV